MQDVEDVGEQRGVRCLMPRQRLQQLPGARHRERQDQPVGLGQGQRPFGRLVRRTLVTELTVGEPGQQLSLDDRDVTDNRRRAVQHVPHRAERRRPDRLPRGRSPRGHCRSRPTWPARQRAPRARRGPRRASRGGPAWPASSRSPGSPAACESASCDRRYSAALNSSQRLMVAAAAGLQHPARHVHQQPDVRPRCLLAGPARRAAATARPRRTHPSTPSRRPA